MSEESTRPRLEQLADTAFEDVSKILNGSEAWVDNLHPAVPVVPEFCRYLIKRARGRVGLSLGREMSEEGSAIKIPRKQFFKEQYLKLYGEATGHFFHSLLEVGGIYFVLKTGIRGRSKEDKSKIESTLNKPQGSTPPTEFTEGLKAEKKSVFASAEKIIDNTTEFLDKKLGDKDEKFIKSSGALLKGLLKLFPDDRNKPLITSAKNAALLLINTALEWSDGMEGETLSQAYKKTKEKSGTPDIKKMAVDAAKKAKIIEKQINYDEKIISSYLDNLADTE